MASVSFRTVTITGSKYNWSSSGNWNPQAPVAGDDVTLSTGTPNLATYTSLDDLSSLTLNSLTVQDSGVTLEIGSGDSLTVQNNISNAGTLDVAGALTGNANLTNSGTIDVTGIFTISNINSNTGSIVAESGGQINLTNVAAGNYTVQTGGQITIAPSGNINGDPTFFIQGGLLTGLNNTPGGATADFAGSAAGHLALNTTLNSNPYTNSVVDVGFGDTIEFNDVSITSVSFNNVTSTLTLSWAGGSRDVHITSFDPSLTNPTFVLATDPVTGRSAAEAVCFMRGTRIRTPDGSKPVELLLIGDKVLTSDGQTRAVRWLWRQTVVTAFADELRVYPIRIMADALEEKVPQRDLFLSPDHAVLLDGCLVQAAALVNDTTIVRVKNPEPKFVYYHIELEDHALILAEGVASETFVDNITRHRFDNYADYEAMYGADALAITEMDVPRAKSARQLPRLIRERLAARSAAVLAGARQAA